MATLGSRDNTLNQPNLPALALPPRVIHLKGTREIKAIKATREIMATVAHKDRLAQLARMLCRLRSLLLL